MRPLSIYALATLGTTWALCVGCSGQRSKNPDASPAQPAGTVTADDIQRTTGDQQIEKALAGRVAGVVVTSSGGDIAVRIRGGSSIYGNNAPLYVVNGMAIEPGPGGALVGISADDIESIRVLKDAVETSAYGSRGANGVILIKLKGPKPRPRPVDPPA